MLEVYCKNGFRVTVTDYYIDEGAIYGSYDGVVYMFPTKSISALNFRKQ